MKHTRKILLLLLLVFCLSISCTTAIAASPDDTNGEKPTLDWIIQEDDPSTIELSLHDLGDSGAVLSVELDLSFIETDVEAPTFTPVKSSVYSTVRKQATDAAEMKIILCLVSREPLDDVVDIHDTIPLGTMKFRQDMTGIEPEKVSLIALNSQMKPMEGTEEENLLLSVQRKTPSYTVRFLDTLNDNGLISSQRIEKGASIGSNFPSAPMHDGYSFKGWFLDADGTTPADENTKVTGTLDVYAVYTKDADESESGSGSGSSGSSGGSSGGSYRPGTQTVTNPDGSKTTTKTNTDGSTTVTTQTKDGMVGTSQLNRSGSLTSAEVTIPKVITDRPETVTLPVVAKPAATKQSSAAKISIRPEDKNAQFTVEIPVSKPDKGVVAVLVNSDGTETIVRDCIVSEDGVILNVKGNTTVKVVENAQKFNDLGAFASWAGDSVDFVSARELFRGMADQTFAPATDMSRGMLVTVLYRLSYEPKAAVAHFADVANNAWFADAIAWAEANNVVNGYGDGTFGPDDSITREQMATLFYRYAKSKGLTGTVSGNLNAFADAGEVDSYAREAMQWCVSTGLIKGMDDTHLAPLKEANRAEVATILMRYIKVR